MNNQSSTPKITFPIFNDDWCPKGKWPEIFNQAVTEYLNNGVILGISQVTQEEIATIQAQLQAQQNEIDALEKEIRRGTIAISTGDNNNPVSFSAAMPDDEYDIQITFIESGTGAPAFSWALVDGTKTAGGMTIRTYDIPASIQNFDYVVTQR